MANGLVKLEQANVTAEKRSHWMLHVDAERRFEVY